MKNLVVTLIVAVVVLASYSQAQAQYAIPSFDVPVVANTTFQDNDWSNDNDGIREERKLKVRVNTGTSRSDDGAWVVISVYKVGTRLQTKLITVVEGVDYTMNIDEDHWGVKVYQASTNCLLSVWDE